VHVLGNAARATPRVQQRPRGRQVRERPQFLRVFGRDEGFVT
jgi:hypothetical protein